jgi:hypothetical protein
MVQFRNLLLFSFLFVVLACPLFTHPVFCESAPSWFKKGVFVELYFDGFPIIVEYGDVMGPAGAHIAPYPGFLRWEVLDFDGEVARMNISLMRDWSREPVRQAEFYVNVSTREVTLLNGTSVGKTYLWFPAHLKVGDLAQFYNCAPQWRADDTLFYDSKSRTVLGIVIMEETIRTCQGYQSAFWVESNFNMSKIYGVNFAPPPVDADFDEDTGILVMGGQCEDGALRAMGIEELISSCRIWDTNVDLGPHIITLDILGFFIVDYPFLTLSIAFVSLVCLVLWARKRHRRHRREWLRKLADGKNTPQTPKYP